MPLHPVPTSLEESLGSIEARSRRGGTTRVRVRLVGGEQIEGALVGASNGHLAVADRSLGRSRRILAAEIREVDVAVRRRGREWLIAAGVIPLATAIVVGYASLPWVDSSAGDVTVAVKALFLGALVALGILGERTVFRRWLTRWQPVYATSPASREARPDGIGSPEV